MNRLRYLGVCSLKIPIKDDRLKLDCLIVQSRYITCLTQKGFKGTEIIVPMACRESKVQGKTAEMVVQMIQYSRNEKKILLEKDKLYYSFSLSFVCFCLHFSLSAFAFLSSVIKLSFFFFFALSCFQMSFYPNPASCLTMGRVYTTMCVKCQVYVFQLPRARHLHYLLLKRG